MKNFKKYIITLSVLLSSWSAFSMKSVQFAAAVGNNIIIQELQQGMSCKTIQTLDKNANGHKDWVCSLAYDHKTGRLFSGSYDETIKIWAPDKTNKYRCIQTLDKDADGHTWCINALAYDNKTGRLFSGSYDRSIKIWVKDENNTYKCIQTLDEGTGGHTSWVYSLAYDNKTGYLFSVSYDKTIKIWTSDENNTYKCIQTLDKDADGHTDWVRALVYDHKTKCLFSGSFDNTIKIWTPDTVYPEATRRAKASSDRPDENNTYKCIQTLDEGADGHTDFVRALAYDHKTKCLFSCSNDKTIKIWAPDENNTYKCIQTKKESSIIFALVILSDNNEDKQEELSQQDTKERIGFIFDDLAKPEEESVLTHLNVNIFDLENPITATKVFLFSEKQKNIKKQQTYCNHKYVFPLFIGSLIIFKVYFTGLGFMF